MVGRSVMGQAGVRSMRMIAAVGNVSPQPPHRDVASSPVGTGGFSVGLHDWSGHVHMVMSATVVLCDRESRDVNGR